MGRPSWLELAGIAALGVFGALWGLSLFLFRDPSDPHWAEFAFGFMGVASAVAVSMLIVPSIGGCDTITGASQSRGRSYST